MDQWQPRIQPRFQANALRAAVGCIIAMACWIRSAREMQRGSVRIFPLSARVASSRSRIMACNWFTLRNTVFK